MGKTKEDRIPPYWLAAQEAPEGCACEICLVELAQEAPEGCSCGIPMAELQRRGAGESTARTVSENLGPHQCGLRAPLLSLLPTPRCKIKNKNH